MLVCGQNFAPDNLFSVLMRRRLLFPGPILPFEDLFGEGREHTDDEAEVDLIEGLPKAQQVEVVLLLSRDDEHARMVGASFSIRHDDELPFIANSMRGAQSDEVPIETVRS